MSHINYDPAYKAHDRDDFDGLLRVERYADRSSDFDEIIARTNEHFWDPLDADYIDYQQAFDMKNEPVIPLDMVGELSSEVAGKLKGREIEFANQSARFMLSQILHGEQGALSLSTSLCQVFVDPGAVEYASNQVREEARHVTAFSEYMKARFEGRPYPVGQTLGQLMNEIYLAPEVYKKIVGMQLLVEGLAMGAFASLYKFAEDPLLRRTAQLVMTDEAFHHKFGKIWADATIENLAEDERIAVEDWAERCFGALLYNLAGANQKQHVYEGFGIDPEWATAAMREAFTDKQRREVMQRPTSIFRVLIKTLVKAGIITDRTRATYAMWVDMKELQSEGDRMVGDDIAEEGIQDLQAINATKKRIIQKL
jgi:1,2-phenylacetyl-CoA epoxidase catalytic subunit